MTVAIFASDLLLKLPKHIMALESVTRAKCDVGQYMLSLPPLKKQFDCSNVVDA